MLLKFWDRWGVMTASGSMDRVGHVGREGSSPLAKIIFCPFCLTQEKRDVLVGGVDESADGHHGLLELLEKLLVFLISPTGAERLHLAVQRGELILGLGTEAPEGGGESAEFIGIDDCLRHGWSPFLDVKGTIRQEFMKDEAGKDFGRSLSVIIAPRLAQIDKSPARAVRAR
jgi:hypothetical protein